VDIIQIDTQNRRQIKQFLALPFRLYRNVPQLVPPFARDARLVFDRDRHPFYRHSDATFFLGMNERQTIGRLAVLDNHNYNAFNGSSAAFFSLFEVENDPDIAQGLFDAAFSWARERGLTHIRGPRGFDMLDGLGLLVKGFEHRPALGIPYNLPYYPSLVESAGFQPIGDILSGHVTRDTHFPERIDHVAQLVQRRRGLKVVSFRTRRDLLALIPGFRELYNASLGSNADNMPLTEDEVQALAHQLLSFADPKLIKIIQKDNELVGFLFAYPDVSAALQRCKGRLFPFGWLRLLYELKHTKWVNINGIGIVERYRGLGGTAILFNEIRKSLLDGGFEHGDLVQVRAENAKMQREMRDFGIDFYKMHRLYEREL